MTGQGRGRGWAVLAAALCLAAAARGYGADWPQFRGPGGDGISAEKDWDPGALSAGPKILWTRDVGVGFSGVAVAHGRLYTMGRTDKAGAVFCLDAVTGDDAWRHEYDNAHGGRMGGPRATPTVADGLVYALTAEGLLLCLEAGSGEVKWKKMLGEVGAAEPPRWKFSASPKIEGKLLVLNAGPAGMALDKQTGTTVWKSGEGVGGYASPVVFSLAGKRYAAFFAEQEIHVVDVATGEKAGSYPWKTSWLVNAADPIVSEGRIFVSSGYGRGCALLDFSSGRLEKVWENKELSSQFSSDILLDGHVYGIDGNTGKNGRLKCLELATGKVVWSQQVGFGSLIAAGGRLIVLNDKGYLIAVEAAPAGYKELGRGRALEPKGKCWTAPAISGGLVYCRDSGGPLVCVDLRPRQ